MEHEVIRNITFFDGNGSPKFVEFPIVVDHNSWYYIEWVYYSEIRESVYETNFYIPNGYLGSTDIEVNAGDVKLEGHFYFSFFFPEIEEYVISIVPAANGNMLISCNDTNPVGVCINYYALTNTYHNVLPVSE